MHWPFVCLHFFLFLKEGSKCYDPHQTMWVLTWILCCLIWRWNKTSHLEWLIKDWGALDNSPWQYHSSCRQQKHHVLQDYLPSVSLCWSRNIRQGGYKGWNRLYNEICHWQQWCQWLERTPIFRIWRRTSLMKVPFLRWWVPVKVEGLDQAWYHYCKDINHLSKNDTDLSNWLILAIKDKVKLITFYTLYVQIKPLENNHNFHSLLA